MPPSLITPPEDVERAMEALFHSIESRDPSMKRFKDADFDKISQLLLQLGKKGWAERPRTYAILRVIGSVSVMDSFINAGLLDIAIPYTQARMAAVLPRDIAISFTEKQSMVMTETYEIEKAGGRHQHLDHDGDAHFSVVRVLGSGGYGEVDHVRSKLSLQDYARKRIRRSKIQSVDQEALQSFMRELTSLKRLKHHHLVTLLGSYTDPKYVGLIMREVADCNLKEYLERTPFPSTEKQCLRGFYGSLASAVAYLHRNRVRHKDLKPQNILVKDQKILITDFGAALDWSDSEKSTTKGRRGQHTPAYMAPEVEDYQARNSSTDIYSLGLIFMDIITVLKGETLDSRVGYFKKNGSRTPFHRTNSVASKSWAQFLEKKTNEDNQPLKWIREMTQERPQDRIKADVLLKKVLAYKDDYCYYSICCEEDETVDENVFDFGIEADHHHVMQVNPDFAQTDPFAESQAQQDQNSQSLTAVGSSRDQGEGKRFIDAAKDGNLLMVKLLIQNGTDIESKDENGQTALMFAAQQGHLTLLKYLLDAGADIECQGNDGWKPLHTAAYNGQLQEVKELIERQALIEAQTNDGQCPLHLACRRGHQETVMLLLERGADIDRETYKGWTALHFAAKHGHESVARLLLTAPQELPGQVLEGANIEATVDKGCNCLHIAADNGEPMLVELFLEMGIDIETRTELEWTPFHFAARSNEKGVALVLLSHGANMQAIAHDGSMPLHMAARNGSDDMAALLIEMGVNIEAVTIDQMMTPLHCAASNGHVETLRLLLQEGAKLTARTIVNYTALHLCCEGNVGSETGRLACARLLLELGIDVHATENGNLTPLHLAAFYGQDSIVEILLEYGGDIHAEDDDTDTPLDCAIRKSHERIARLLIERGADIMRKDGRAMRFAVKAGHEGIVRLLVRNGADTEGYEELLQVLDLNDDRSRDEDGAAKPSSEDLAAIAKMLEEDEKNPGACNQTPSRSQTTIRRPNCGQSQDVELNRVIEQSRVLAQIREQEQIRELEQRSEIEHKRELEKRREDEKKQEDEERRELEQASQKDSDAIQRLCDYGFDIALAIEAYSISRKNEEEAKIMLLELYEDFVESDITRYDPGSLRKSVEKGDMAELKILLAMGCNINEVSKTDQTALMCAATKGQESFVQILLEYGADVSIQNSAGLTALHFATEAGNKAAAKLLLENGADIGARSKKGWTPLGFASPSIRPFLEEWSAPPKSVDMEADSNFEEEFQEPAPLKSFPTGSTESTNSSQSNTIRKAPPPVPTKNPELAKRYGKRPGSTTMSDISAASFTGISSITGNASVASPENTVDLIENSIDPNMTIRIHRLPSSESRATATIRPKLASSSPSTQSSESKSKGPIRPQLDSSSPRNSLLYSRPAAAIQPQATSSSRSIPMITSSTSNVPTIASSISSIPTMASSPPSTPSLESRSISPQQPKASLASPEPRSIAHPQPSSSPSSSTIPPIASTRNTPSPAPERLQPSPALPYPPTVTTPAQTLHQAVSRGTALELIALLKKSHTHPSSPIDSQLNTPLHLACADDSDLKVRLLLKYGADVNAANSLGNTPLHKAAQHGHAAIVKLLFGSNASVNAKNNDGSTPLHLAAFYGNIKVVRLLCDCGGETGLKDRDGLDVLGAAKQGERLQAGNQREHDETLRFLKLRI